MNKRLIILMALTAFLCGFSQGAKVWDIGGPIAGGSISSPVDNGMYICGAGVDFTCTRGTDPDHWCDASVPSEGTPNDAMATNYPQWTASAGSWKDGDYIGTSVEWIAPNSELTNITVSVYENDLPYSIPSGDSGTRDDSVTLQDTVTGILVFIPFLYEVDYGGGNHAIYDVTTPEFHYAVRNEPAAWSFGADATAEATFYRPGATLSQNEGGIKVRAETSGDGFNIGDWGDSATATWTLPSPSMTCVSEMTIDSSVQYQDYSAQWKYKCTNGSNSWIETTNQTGCRLYVVYDSPKCSSADYTKDHLEKATTYASGGGSSKTNVCTTLQSYLHSNQNFKAATGSDGENGVWNIIDPGGSGNGGDCIAHANLMKVCLEVLGIDASYAYVADATNQPSETAPAYKTYWCETNSRYERRHFREGAGGTIWNFEGVCGVDGTYYDVAWSTTSGTYSYCKTEGNGIVYEWLYVYESGGSWYVCGNQGDTHTP